MVRHSVPIALWPEFIVKTERLLAKKTLFQGVERLAVIGLPDHLWFYAKKSQRKPITYDHLCIIIIIIQPFHRWSNILPAYLVHLCKTREKGATKTLPLHLVYGACRLTGCERFEVEACELPGLVFVIGQRRHHGRVVGA